jgi:diadenosine tetraphosphate (Ap4A) HIT family hydrolase
METNLAGMSNPIANRIQRIRDGADPQALGRLHSGYAILANQQPDEVRGCCMLLPDPTPAHLRELDHAGRAQFMTDLALLGEAVQEATGCERVNYLILCNQVPWLHGHVVPRYASEDPEKFKLDPFAAYDFPGARKADATGPDRELHAKLKGALDRLMTAGDLRPWADLI